MARSHSSEGAKITSSNIEEYRLFQIYQNSPKKVWPNEKKYLYFYNIAQGSLTVMRLNLDKARSRKPYELVKLSGDFSTITHRLATGRGE